MIDDKYRAFPGFGEGVYDRQRKVAHKATGAKETQETHEYGLI